MKLIINRSLKAKRLAVPDSLLALSGLAEEAALEFHTGENTLVAVPAKMTAMEMVNVIHTLHELSVDLSAHLALACGDCDECGLCKCIGLESDEPVVIPSHVLEDAGLPPGCKLTTCVDEDGSILVEKAGYDYDLTDVPDYILESFREGGACLSELEDRLMVEDVVYDAAKEEECPCTNLN